METVNKVASTFANNTGKLPKVAVIGAGVSGLLSARHLKDIADVKVYESKEDIGGVWLYTDYSERNHPDLKSNAYFNLYNNLHSSLYYNLMTNVPKQCMTFKDFYHSKETPYIMQSEVFHDYMKSFVNSYDLMKYISLNTTVSSLKVTPEADHRYEITSVPTDVSKGSEPNVDYFDYVMIWNGHFTVPNIPDFEGKDQFEGIQFHMHELRKLEPEEFDDKNVLIVGAWVSANDLVVNIMYREETRDLVHPKKIFLTSRNTTAMEQSEDYAEAIERGQLVIKPGNVSKITKDTVVFGDGTEEQIDTIVYATGYKYWMPFIDPKDNIIEFEERDNKGYYFGPLYKRMFCINEPQIFFIGLVEKLPLIHPTYERQVLLAKQCIKGDLKLPSKDEMLDDLTKELKLYEDNGLEKIMFYKFTKTVYSFWDYNIDLENMWRDSGMEVDEVSNESLRKAMKAKSDLVAKGNAVQTKELDYGQYLDDIDYKPVSNKF